jgi:DNA polymerase III epsilon subunit-like protein
VFCDVETSGLSYVGNNPTVNPFDGKKYQAVSLGAIITDRSYNVIDTFYTLIKFDASRCEWEYKAQVIHGLSQKVLAAEGVPSFKFAENFEAFLLKAGIDTSYGIHFVGHNFRGFDAYFIDDLMSLHGRTIKFAGRCFDSNSLCLLTGTTNSTELFEDLSIKRKEPHNALSDCQATLEAFRVMTQLVQAPYPKIGDQEVSLHDMKVAAKMYGDIL